ncbi:MAG: TRAP transporter TatT component family protein [Proteobacteria bacterium]|nr:TRAP transporter TatT component family protein [Pseudomonadota bacterium]
MKTYTQKHKMTARNILLLLTLLLLNACSIHRIPDDMGYGVLNNDDLITVRDGLPTYLLLIDGGLITYPDSKSLLLTSASLNSAYSGVFVENELRKLKMTDKAFSHAQRAMCLYQKTACNIKSAPFDGFEKIVMTFTKEKDLPYLYALASSWTSYIELTSDDYNSIAELGRVEMLMKQVVKIDETYQTGMPMVYLGVLNSLIPPALGGKPEIAKDYFERAIAISAGKNLIAKVLYAEKYARLMFEQELHDRLLNEVLATKSAAHGLTLQNEYAKVQAQILLDDSADYF